MADTSFARVADLFPEPMLLVSRSGLILAANAAVARLHLDAGDLAGSRLTDVCSAPPGDELQEYLGLCARTRQSVPGGLVLRNTDGGTPYRVDGARYQAAADGHEATALLRLIPRRAVAARFALLNRQLEEQAREISRRGQVEQRLREQREWLRVVLASIDDAVVVTDAQGDVRFINPVAEDLTGWHKDEASGRHVRDVICMADVRARGEGDDPAEAVRGGATPTRTNEAFLVRRDGSRCPVEQVPAPIRDGDGTLVGSVVVFRDVTERQRIEEERRRLSAIVETSDDAIFSKTLDGRMTSWNAAASRMYLYTAEEMIGQHVSVLVPPDRAEELADVLARLRRGERIDHFETERVRKDGTRISVSLSISALRLPNGIVTGASTIARDISERKRAEEERAQLLARERAARAEAQVASRTKDEFLAALSHELRTPLNAVLGWTRMLSGGTLDQEQAARALTIIERNAQAQAQLISDLLDVSRFVTDTFRLDLRPVDIGRVVASAIDAVQVTASAKGVAIQSVAERQVPLVPGDATRLQQVVWNLLSNSIKFTPAGGVITVRVAPTPAGVQIAVRDTGQGIRPEFLPHVFDRFRQADGSISRRHGGLGLGLAIVRSVIAAHAGTVTADSAGEGMGATFVVTLPAIGDETEAAGVSERALYASGLPPAGQLDGLRVLVVEDDVDSREFILVVLAHSQAEVRAAASAAEALALLPDFEADVIISDLAMPGEDGFTFIRRLRALETATGRRVPAIALTGFAAPEDRARVLAAGFQLHVAKPVHPSELVAAVGSLAGRFRHV